MIDRPEQFRELADVRQHVGEPKRRWFVGPGMDLIVWFDEWDRPFKFQLCYEVWLSEYALTWEAGRGFNHARIDSGEHTAGIRGTPILCDDKTPFDQTYLMGLFQTSNSNLPTEIKGLVSEALRLYPSSPMVSGRRPLQKTDGLTCGPLHSVERNLD